MNAPPRNLPGSQWVMEYERTDNLTGETKTRKEYVIHVDHAHHLIEHWQWCAKQDGRNLWSYRLVSVTHR